MVQESLSPPHGLRPFCRSPAATLQGVTRLWAFTLSHTQLNFLRCSLTGDIAILVLLYPFKQKSQHSVEKNSYSLKNIPVHYFGDARNQIFPNLHSDRPVSPPAQPNRPKSVSPLCREPIIFFS